MGDHYAPKKYLSGFCDRDGKIWVYDRIIKKHFRTSLMNVAQENGFYSREDERELNELVEQPANPVLDDLRDGKEITNEDRDKLATYIATFIYRVPYSRALGASFATKERLAEFINLIKNEIKTRDASPGIDSGLIDRKLKEADAVYVKYADDPTKAIMDQIRSPWPSEKICEVIRAMNWRLLTTTGPSYFVTSDNPAFFFQSLGLAKSGAELSFPVSTEILLHGSWQPCKPCEKVAINQQYLKEMNRRAASKTSRFLFYHKQAAWLSMIADKGTDGHRLNRINW